MTVSNADPQPLSSIPFFAHSTALVETDQIGEGTRIWAFGHVLKGAEIGCNCNVGDHCYIEGGAKIGNEVVIKNGVSIWTGVIIEDHVFVGPHVAFTNDLVPRAKVYRGEYDRTRVKEGASIGANATLLCPLTIGRHALVGAGAVVTHDIPDFGLAYGNPARLAGFVCKCGKRLSFALDQDSTSVCQCGLSYEKRDGRVTETVSSTGAHGDDRGQSLKAAPSHNVTSTFTHSIPLVDLRAQHDELRPEIEAVIRDIVDRSCFIGGSYVEVFEHDFAAYCGAHHTVGCASGTDALRLALMAAGVRPGDEVITVPFTFIATAEAITQIGAHPVFVDVDLSTYTLNPDRLTEFLEQNCHLNGDGQPVNIRTGRRAAAVIPVHLYGLPADMDPILALAERYQLKVIEDACQAHGALHRTHKESRGERDEVKVQAGGRRTGTLGHVGCFSFYPGKNLGAMGEAGALVTQDPEIADRARVLRDHGERERYIHVSPDGWNGRLDAIQAAVLGIKLHRLDEWNERRRQVAQWYNQRLADRGISLPVEREHGHHIYHLYVIRVPDRDRVRAALAERGIATGLHYPIPLHLQDAYRHLGYREGDLRVSEEVARSVLSLPMYPHLSEEQVDYVCRCLDEVLSH